VLSEGGIVSAFSGLSEGDGARAHALGGRTTEGADGKEDGKGLKVGGRGVG